MSPTNPKTQHWVPNFYLRQFATLDTINKKKGKQQVHVQSVENAAKYFLSNTSGIAAENHLYTLVDPETGKKDWRIEHKFAEYEKLIAKLWPVFLEWDLPFSGGLQDDYKRIPHGDVLRKALSIFMTQLHVRNPYNKKVIEKEIKKQLIEIRKLPKDPSGKPLPFTVKFASGERVDVNDTSDWENFESSDPEFINSVFLSSIEVPLGNLNKIFYNKTWQIIVAKNKQFLTCDRPIVVEDESIGMERSRIYFPLSSTRCLIMSDKDSGVEGYYHAVEEFIPSINLLTIQTASAQVYSQADPIHAMKDVDLLCQNLLLSKDLGVNQKILTSDTRSTKNRVARGKRRFT